jgi:hypothetical protein
LSYSANSAVETIKKSPRWGNDEGVAATIGTIMSLLVFLTFMGMFTNQFLPVWMSDNESTHMATVISQIQDLKSQIDGLVADYANSVLAPTPIFVPITLHATGIPIFAEPTAGILTMVHETGPVWPFMNVTYDSDSDFDLSGTTGGHCGGYIDMYAPNRYYVEQHLVYECGAVILNQTDGEFIIAGPGFTVNDVVVGSEVHRVVKLTQISLLGSNKTVGGTGTKGVTAEMLYAGTTALTSSTGSDVTLTIFSKHGPAWESYFKRSLNASIASLEYGVDFTVDMTMYDLPGRYNDYYVVTVTIDDVQVLDHSTATVHISIGDVAL